ncbi:MAG: DUF262 domain-containing protein [Candidatus Binatia bacterium]
MTLQDFLAALQRGEITVNRDYQRSDQVWPDAARSYLVETVLKDFPIPKLSLRQVTDPKTGDSYKEIVDGQQRCAALRAFSKNEFSLSNAVEDGSLRGFAYDDLSREQQATFKAYQMSLDIFLGAEPGEIREVFRRMNSYTVPLNPEEQRHAQFQGKFKWFLHRLGLGLNEAWVTMVVFSQKQIVRMADTKLLAEVCHAICRGISTTNKRSLDQLYAALDEEFAAEQDIEARLTDAVEVLLGWPDLHGSVLMKPFQVYGLLLAITHVTRPVPTLADEFPIQKGQKIDYGTAMLRLTRLAEVIEQDQSAGKYARFVKASAEKTNVKAERETRFKYFCQALIGA